MTTVDAAEDDRDRASVHATLLDQSGRSFLGVGRPLAGKDRFLEHLLSQADADARDTLHVACTRGYDRVEDSIPERTAVVDCSPASARDSARVTTVGSPADLTGIGMPVSAFLEEVGQRPLVTVDSVSTLLGYADESAVFRFLAVLTAQIRRVNGVGLFLLEAGCHDRQTVSTFQQLFDGRVDVEAERVRVRGLDGVSPGWESR